jgi:hypothetical protein
VTTKHAAAVVLLLTIAGTPVTTLACVGWCVPRAVPVSVSCHHQGSGTGGKVENANDTCATLLATSPFLPEDTQPIRTAASTPYALSRAEGEPPLVSVHNVAPAVPQRAASPLILRL